MAKQELLTQIKITKPDGTYQIAPYSEDSLAFYQHYNNRILHAGEQWKLERVTDKEASELPYRDENFITPKEAQDKVPEMAQRIAELEAKLAEINADSTPTLHMGTVKNAVSEEKQKASLESATAKHKDK